MLQKISPTMSLERMEFHLSHHLIHHQKTASAAHRHVSSHDKLATHEEDTSGVLERKILEFGRSFCIMEELVTLLFMLLMMMMMMLVIM